MAEDVQVAAEEATPPRPEWLPERYETPEQLAKAYAEAERKITELSEKAKQADALEQNYAALAEQVESLQAQASQASQRSQQDPLITGYQEAMEMGNYAHALAIQDQLTQLRLQQFSEQFKSNLPNTAPIEERQAFIAADYAFRNLSNRYGEDFASRREEIAKTLEDYSLIRDEAVGDVRATEQALEAAYKLVNPAAFVDKSLLRPQEDDTAKRLAQTAQGAGVRELTADEAKAEWDKIRAAGTPTYYAQ